MGVCAVQSPRYYLSFSLFSQKSIFATERAPIFPSDLEVTVQYLLFLPEAVYISFTVAINLILMVEELHENKLLKRGHLVDDTSKISSHLGID